MNKAIMTLPLSPVKSTDFGRMVTPVIAETLGKILNAKYYLCVNLLDSFKDREESFKNYIQTVDKSGIKYDYLWKDSQNIDKMLEQLKKLVSLGFIYEKKSIILRCPCGIVEIEKKNVQSCNPNDTQYITKDGGMVCSHCHSKCCEYEELSLIFDPTCIKNKQIRFLPKYLNNDIKTFQNIILDSYNIISRKRNTGITCNYNGNIYNIDIDFLWSTYLSLFSEEEKIVICGNHELYQLFMVGVVEKCLDPESKSIFIGTPFVKGMKDYNLPCETHEDELIRKLLILFNIKWNIKEKDIDGTILGYLKRISYEKKVKLYDIMCRETKNQKKDFYELVNDIMYERINMQRCVNNLKVKGR